ncbi:MAG: tRNA glutamyl-Q(34) synthetase GluQRS [Planctomycetota bacterium]|nr:tRNA glutamyl-Q(34) synthetase GluQRS [Planctomycetota bacterium]
MRDQTTPVGRLAPSPTGVLHLGNARSLLLAWLSIRSRGGVLSLRIEDIDGPRVRAGAIDQTIEDLLWLGLDWDGEPLIQTQQLSRHQQSLDLLQQAGWVYPCTCTRKEVEEAASAPHESHGIVAETVYPGTCRDRWRDVEEARTVTGRDPALRLRVTPSSVPFVDLFAGAQEGQLSGDFVIQKSDGTPSYQLAVVVDDAAQGVTEVLRADDLLTSTPRQILLYQHLNAALPQFIHVPLVVGPDGRRLAKRHGDTSVARYRRDGISSETLVGALAFASGLATKGTRCRPEDLLGEFQLDRIPAEPVVWDGQRCFEGED